MSKIPSLHFQIEIWAIVFSISSLINFEIVYIWPISKFGEEDLVYNSFLFFFFFTPKRVALCSKHWFFYFLLNYHLFCPNRSYQGQNYQNVAIVRKGVSASLSFFIPPSWYHPLSLEKCNAPPPPPPLSSWHNPLQENTRFYDDTLE